MRYRLLSFAPLIVICAFFIIAPLAGQASWVFIFTKFFIWAIFALSLDLIFGYAGLMSLGHAAFFAMGAYTTGLLVLNGITQSLWLLLPASILASAVLASIFGLIALRTRGMYFLLVTLALGALVYSTAHSWRGVTRGDWGLVGIPRPEFAATDINFYYFAFVILIICYLLLYLITKSSFGQALVGIRENELRMKSLGYNIWVFKYIAFILAGAFAGIAGMTHAFFTSHVGPDTASVAKSAMVMLMPLLGGPGTLFGAVLGAGVITFLEYYVSLFVAARWPLVLGIIFIAVIMYARGGIGPYLLKIWTKVEERYGNVKG